MGTLKEEHKEYIEKGIKSGQMPSRDVALVVTISILLDKPIMEVQDAYMDAQNGIQTYFRKSAGIKET